MAERLAEKMPELFVQNLRHDAGLRGAREALPDTSAPGDIDVFDARNSWDSTPPRRADAKLPQGVRLHAMATATSALLGTVDVPDGVVRYGQKYANAFYDGRNLVFGMGDGEVFGDFTLGLDIFAHEYGHKIVDAGPRLEYAGQPGALNEHVADVIAVCVRSATESKDSQYNWLVGKALFLDGVSALRNMKEPGSAYNNRLLGADPQVGHMDTYVQTFKDNGGVHLNSGIPNRAFALFSEAYGGPVHQEPLNIWLSALAKSGPLTNFYYFAGACIESAGPLAGAVREAWKSVGVVAA